MTKDSLLHAGKQDHETAVWGSLCRDKAGVMGGTEATDSQEKGGRGLWDSGGDWKLRCHAEPGSDRQKQLGGPVDPEQPRTKTGNTARCPGSAASGP